MKKIILFLVCSVFYYSVQSQTKSEISEIVKDYDIDLLKNIALDAKHKFKQNQDFILKTARENNWKINFKEKNGKIFSLRKIINGKPVYIQTTNVNAAKSTRSSFLHNGGILGLNIEGQNMTAHVWDGGHARITHNEFNIGNGNSKIVYGDNATDLSDHSTHVCGTIAAIGANSSAKGIAPQASIISYNWDDDYSQATTAASNGMLISNHSYGYSVDDLPDWQYGAYTTESRKWDNLLYNAPYYNMVIAAGNDGSNASGNDDPLEGNHLFDKLSDNVISKNPIAVANGQDLFVDSNGEILNNIALDMSSSQGPTDDYRIKPDITGNGTAVYSCVSTSDSSYDSYYGTSMASPSVASSLLLLQQLYNDTNGNFAKAATIKGLALHTADDGGTVVGPDARFGWGYMNSLDAARVIISNTDILDELVLNENETITFEVDSNGIDNLEASICWTDPPANNVNYGFANRIDPVLVNDLDLRISKNGTTYFPWKLTGVNSNDKMDNNVDPYEKVEVENASGTYTISISSKGDLYNNSQNLSLIVTGISSNNYLALNSLSLDGFNIWPNPSKGVFKLSFNNSNNAGIKVYDILGKIAYQTLLISPKSEQLDLSNLEKGVYFMYVNQNNQVSSKKIILN